MVAAVSIFCLTLLLVIWQPRGLGVGWSAAGGAVVALLAGVVQLQDVLTVWSIVWNATFTFIALIVISLLLDEAGFFAWAALHVGRWGRGRPGRLFVLLILLGAAISAVFANDGAALILTPIVVAMLANLRLSAATTLAFVMAAGFIADTASLPLVVSNLTNLIVADYFGVSFNRYAAVMVPVNFASVAASLLVLWWVFRCDLPTAYDPTLLPEPRSAIRDRATFRVGACVLLALLVGLFALEPLGIPVCVVAGICALALLLVAGRGRVISTRRVMRHAPWHIVVFSLGMYLVVYGLRNQGLTDTLGQLLGWFASQGLWSAALGSGVLAAVLSSVMNNLPAVLVGALAIEPLHVAEPIRQAMVFGNLIGCDLGPKITPIGSLATLLWLHVLAGKGVKIGWGYYCRIGVVLTVPVLLATLAALALRLQWG